MLCCVNIILYYKLNVKLNDVPHLNKFGFIDGDV